MVYVSLLPTVRVRMSVELCVRCARVVRKQVLCVCMRMCCVHAR